MKHTPFALLMIGFVVFSTAFTTTVHAQKLISSQGKMSVKFPAEYTKTDDGLTVKYSAVVGEQTFFAAYTIHEVELEDKMGLSEVSLEEFNNILNGTILQKTEWKVKKNTGLKGVIRMATEETKVQYHVVMVGQIQYQVVVIAPEATWDQKSTDKFVKSFKILK
ncbi:MAG: hypothetical protein R2730_09930 [Chitinophagales bacterium]